MTMIATTTMMMKQGQKRLKMERLGEPDLKRTKLEDEYD
jgi:hypothetical protein